MEQVTTEDFQIIDNCLMIKLPEEVDHHRAGFICENADRLLCRKEVCNVVFDFENTRFMDSSGIAVVINALRNMTQIEGKLLLSGISSQPMRVFRASGIDKLVEIREAVS